MKNDPAYPSCNDVRCGDILTAGHSGMTVRQLFAMHFMQAIISKSPHESWSEGGMERAGVAPIRARGAVTYADALIKELKEL